MTANTISYGDIKISGYQLVSVVQLQIVQAINEHAEMQINGLVPEDIRESYLKEFEVNKPIQVEKGDVTLFNGIIVELEVTHINSKYYISIRALSHTYIMDVVKKKRSFQDTEMKFGDLVEVVISQYGKTNFMDMVTNDALIKKPIIQYKETDWEFLKRMASRFYTVLVPHCISEGVNFYFGLSNVDKGEIEAYNYHCIKDISRYRESVQGIPGVSENDFVFYEVETNKNLNIGEAVTFKGKKMYVIKSILKEQKDAKLTNTCILAFEAGVKRPRLTNNNISGCSIFGCVIATARDTVKVHLEIDKKQDVSKAYWYPYATMYASEDETGWYCMPEINDTIRLYFPDDEEEKAMAINSVKPHDPDEDVEKLDPDNRMANTDVKYLRTAFGKELKFRPDGIDVISKDGLVFMTLSDDGTVTINSNDKISFTAANDIEMKARNVNVEATDHIKIEAKESSIDLESDIIVKGKEVKTN